MFLRILKYHIKYYAFISSISRLMRLLHLSPSVNSIFKHACAAIHWGYMSDFWSDPSSTSILYVCEQRRLWRDCADAQSRLSLRCSPMRYVPQSHVLAHIIIRIGTCRLKSQLMQNLRSLLPIAEPPHDKTNKISVRPAKTQISLCCALNG